MQIATGGSQVSAWYFWIPIAIPKLHPVMFTRYCPDKVPIGIAHNRSSTIPSREDVTQVAVCLQLPFSSFFRITENLGKNEGAKRWEQFSDFREFLERFPCKTEGSKRRDNFLIPRRFYSVFIVKVKELRKT